MAGAFAGDGEAVKLARETDREIADVDHLLHFAEALLQDLAGFEADETAERVLVGAQLFAQQAHELAAARRRHSRQARKASAARAPAQLGSPTATLP